MTAPKSWQQLSSGHGYYPCQHVSELGKHINSIFICTEKIKFLLKANFEISPSSLNFQYYNNLDFLHIGH